MIKRSKWLKHYMSDDEVKLHFLSILLFSQIPCESISLRSLLVFFLLFFFSFFVPLFFVLFLFIFLSPFSVDKVVYIKWIPFPHFFLCSTTCFYILFQSILKLNATWLEQILLFVFNKLKFISNYSQK